MNKLSKEKKKQIAVVAMVVVVAIAGLWFGLISAQKKRTIQVASQIETSKDKLKKVEQTIRNRNAIQADLDNTSAQLHQIETTMASSGDLLSWMFLTINQFKIPYNVDIPQISSPVPGDATLLPNFPYKQATYVVRGTAYYHDFGRFLADFENTFPYIRVQNLRLEPSSSGTATGDTEKLAFEMEIVALIRPSA